MGQILTKNNFFQSSIGIISNKLGNLNLVHLAKSEIYVCMLK